MNNYPFTVEPSVICADLCNLESEIKKFEVAGCGALHIDVLDGAFSPSLPVGIDTFIALSKRTNIPFDVHIMSNNNEWFIDKCIEMNPKRICFHCEKETHIARMVSKIKSSGISAGIAFAPSTKLDVAGYALYECDFVLLMRIEPGFASFANESKFDFMDKKIKDTREMLDRIRPGIGITIDGRVTFEDIPHLLSLGANTLVGGSKSLFISHDYSTNYKKAMDLYNLGVKEHE